MLRPAAAGQPDLDDPRLPVPRRRDAAGNESPLSDPGVAHEPRGAGASRDGRQRRGHARPGVRRAAVRARPAPRRRAVFHHRPRRDRPRRVFEAFGRPADEVSRLRLRRHGRGSAPPGGRTPRYRAPGGGDRQFHGRHAHMAVGSPVSGLRGRDGSPGIAARGDERPQLADPADGGRHHQGRPGVERRQLPAPAAEPPSPPPTSA